MVISIGTAVHKTLTTTPNLSYIPGCISIVFSSLHCLAVTFKITFTAKHIGVPMLADSNYIGCFSMFASIILAYG